MTDFIPLSELLTFNFEAMRAVEAGCGNYRATDNAIKTFVLSLNYFFESLTEPHPSHFELNLYIDIMERIMLRINQSEYQYFLNKYQGEHMEDAELAAQYQKIELHKLPNRMQFWAAGERFGDTIRNVDLHKKAVSGLIRWSSWANTIKTTSLQLTNQNEDPNVEETVPSPFSLET